MTFRVRGRRMGAVVTVAAVLVGAGITGASARSDDASGGRDRSVAPVRAARPFTVGLFGDMPYGALGRAQYPNLLADINAAHVAFSVFDGDLKAGGDGACTDELYATALADFNTLSRPLVWLPGDNDWTDCWGRYGPGTGGYDPIERLAHEREVFTSTDRSLGRQTMRLTRQSDVDPDHPQYSENVRWTYGPVVFLGLNVQGSNDNYPYAGVGGETRSDEEIARARAESLARREANLAWLRDGFAYAQRTRAKGVMVIWQADPNFNNAAHLSDARLWDAYPPYVDALRELTMGFDGQVALVHGDSHTFIIDKPLTRPGGGVLATFTRVETFGARDTHWVAATIDPRRPGLFVFEPRIVPANAS